MSETSAQVATDTPCTHERFRRLDAAIKRHRPNHWDFKRPDPSAYLAEEDEVPRWAAEDAAAREEG